MREAIRRSQEPSLAAARKVLDARTRTVAGSAYRLYPTSEEHWPSCRTWLWWLEPRLLGRICQNAIFTHQRVVRVPHTALLVLGDSFVVRSTQFGPSGKLVLCTDSVHLTLQADHLLLQSCRVLRIFCRWCRELVVEDPEL